VSSDREPGSSLRVGLAFAGDPSSPASWSGIPAGLRSGLAQAGAEPVPIDARFPGSAKLARTLRRSWAQVAASDGFAAVSSAAANRAARGADLDGVVALGSGFALSDDLRTVTFDDMTVEQAMRREDPAYQALGTRAARRWRERQKLTYERSHACCVTSRWVAESVHRDYGVPRERIHVVGLGGNVEATGNPGRDWSAPRFIFGGFSWERKRGDAVVAAFTELRHRHPGATLDLVGNHPPIEAGGVTGHGPLPLDSESGQRRYRELLADATCFVMPSAYEPFGIAHVDAAAAGLPSIGTTEGGVRDAIGPGGVVVEPGDDDALLEAMFELAVPETARRLGELALAHSTLFTWRAVGERTIRALEPPGVDLDGLSEFLPAPEKTGLG
jgi:glycosyltransferase involved in cell wall biosynthesis